ncbi:MAG TPA: hypothetical protein VF941_14950 [Clostridia bacterium]
MANVGRGMVKGIGITSYKDFPDLRLNPDIFTEVAIPELVEIPKCKPDIEDLLSIAADIDVISVRLIDTAKGISNEGQNLSGHKLIIELKLRQKVKYIAADPAQSVHAAHFENVINSVYVVVPAALDVGNPAVKTSIRTLFKQGRLVVTPYIEDIYGELRDKRTIFKNIIVFVHVTAAERRKFSVKYYAGK